MNTELVFEKVCEGANRMFAPLPQKGDTDAAQQRATGGKAMQFPIFTAFGIGLYALMKVTGKKKFHRKGEEHGSARWANKKEIKSLLDKPPKQKRKLLDLLKCLFKRKPKPKPKKTPKPKKGEFIEDRNIILTNDVKMSQRFPRKRIMRILGRHAKILTLWL